jgi:3'-5' exonuclease
MKTVTFDLETILNPAAAERCHYVPKPDEFAPWPLHLPVCVSMLTVERLGGNHQDFSIRTLSRGEMSEWALLSELEQHLAAADQVISYNGRGFDVPVLLTRAAAIGIEVPTIAALASRSRLNHHLDLAEVVAGGGAPRVKLAELCAALAIPAKIDASGAGVADLCAAGDFKAVSYYCETDVAATWIALHLWESTQALHRREAWADLTQWIEKEQPRLEHLLPYRCALPSRARDVGFQFGYNRIAF